MFAYVYAAVHSISFHFISTVGWAYQARPFWWGWNGLPVRYLQECYDSWPSWTFTLKCCPKPGMVCQQSLSWYLVACQDLLFSNLRPFSLSFSSSLVLGQASASVSKTRTPKSKIRPPKSQKKKWNGCRQRLLNPVLFLCLSLDFPSGTKTPRQKIGESSMQGAVSPVLKQD